MSRPIKFRAWDKKNSKWSPCYGFHIIGETTAFDLLNQYSVKAYDDLEITQFTGLKDEDGLDVYEGDIVKFYYTKDGKTFYTEGEVYFNEESRGYKIRNEKYFWSNPPSDNYNWLSFYNNWKAKVIGNIYETNKI